jgi:hypothetical protein
MDVSDNALVIRFATGNAAGAAAAVRGYILSARNGSSAGDWQGAGITSDVAIADPGNRALGYALSGDLLGASGGTFMGNQVDGSSVLVRMTLTGDATLDGQVDFTDLARLAQHYNSAGSAIGWLDGDFNYDGQVDFLDLSLMAQHYNTALPSAAALAGAPAGFETELARAFAAAAVPEPGSCVVAGAALVGLLARRRRGPCRR